MEKTQEQETKIQLEEQPSFLRRLPKELIRVIEKYRDGPLLYVSVFPCDFKPSGICYTKEQHLLVCNGWGNQVVEYDEQGKVVSSFIMDHPCAITVDRHDNVFLIDNIGQVRKSKRDGTQDQVFVSRGALADPVAVAMDSQDNLYVCDSYQGQVKKFDATGNLLLVIGSEGNGPQQLTFPRGIALHEQCLYVCDTENDRIQVYDIVTGKHVKQIAGRLNSPASIAIDERGNMLVGDAGGEKILHICMTVKEGKWVGQWKGAMEDKCGQMNWPYSMAEAADGTVWVSDMLNQRMVIVKLNK